VNILTHFFREVRYAVRALAKQRSRGFAVVAILTLALGIGASTSIFSIVDAVLLRALPYPEPRELVRVWEQAPDGHRMNLSDPNFDDFRDQNDTFAGLAAYSFGSAAVSGGSEPVRVDAAWVSRGFFRVLGVEPAAGREFAAEELRPHGAAAVIVSHGYWERYLGGTRDLAKARFSMSGTPYRVVGVMPAGFDFPAGVSAWIPRELEEETPSRTAHNWRAVGRLRPGTSVEQARANLSAIAGRIHAQYGKDVDLTAAAVVPLGDSLVGDVRTALVTLLAAVCLLLLVACTNVAGLLLARTSTRRRELAVRVALGADRRRLVQQFLAESFALSAAAGVLGVLTAAWAVRLLPAILPASLPRKEGIAIHAPVLLFAVLATTAVAVALGLFAAWRADTGDLQKALAAGSRGSGGAAASRRLRGFLVVGEIAATLVILVGAGLLGRSFLRLVSTSPGFRQEHLITAEFPAPLEPVRLENPTAEGAPASVARQVARLDGILDRLRAIPGAESVGIAGAYPVAAGDNLADGTFLKLDGGKSPADFEEWGRMARNAAMTGHASFCVAGSAYFRALGIPLLRGRMFDENADAGSTHYALISQTLARRSWPGQDPIGRVINFGNMDGNLKPLTIVGVVGDVRAAGLDLPPSSVIYVDYRQRGMRTNASPTVVLRSGAPPGEIVSAARGVFRELAPDVPVRFSTFAESMGGWLSGRRTLLLLVGLFAFAALGLAALGVYGIVAFSVAHRVQEIGVRMALGAERGDVLRLVLGEGTRLALAGVGIGVLVSLAMTRLLSSLLFGISATDPATFAGVAAVLTAVALAASFIPARRAMRLDPNVALRYE
jgi:putative ABC transport system permease protein